MQSVWRFLIGEDGTTAVEYAVILALIMMSVISGITLVGGSSGGMWGSTQTKLGATNFGK